MEENGSGRGGVITSEPIEFESGGGETEVKESADERDRGT